MKSSLTTNVPKPPLQGGHGKAPVQGTRVQAKSGAKDPGPSTSLYTKQPSGTRGSGTTAGKPGKTK
jgi:hypothetical protein